MLTLRELRNMVKVAEVKEHLTTDSNGAVILKNLHLGTYLIREVQAPENFYNGGEEKEVTLSYAGQNVDVVFSETTFTNDRQKAKVTVTKKDQDTEHPLDGGIFGLYAADDIVNADEIVVVKKGTLIEKATTGNDGTATFLADLPIGFSYDVKEEQAPSGYVRNTKDVFTFDFVYTNDREAVVSFSHTFVNERVKAKISLQKKDKETNTNQPQGDDEYGSEVADIIVSENGTLVAEDLRNGFDAEAGFAISEYLEENGASVYDLKELPADTDIVLYDGKELYTEKAQPIINDSWDYSMIGIDENGEEYRFNFYEIHSVATEKGLRLKMPELHYIDHYYVVEDLQKQGKLDVREYSSLSEALENYFALPTHKMKALGIQNQSPLPGSLDFIQCKNGVDHLTEDWTKVTGWLNPQIYQTVQYLKESLEVHETQIAYDTGIGFFAIQHTDGGYDYTFYDKDYLEKDGGVYDDPEFTIEEAAGDLLAEEGISIHDCKVMDYEELMECVENAEKEQQAEPSLTYYVAECMEFSVLGEYHADLTIDEAFDIYKRIPSDRMNGGKGIGICLQEDSLYAGEYPLMRSNQIDMETLEGIPYMKNHPLVQQAVKEMEQRGVKLWYPIKEAQAEKGTEQRQEQPQRESKKESVLKALKERQERLKAQQTEPKRPERSQSKKKGDMEL